MTASRTAGAGSPYTRRCCTARASKCGTTAIWASSEAHWNRYRNAARDASGEWPGTPPPGARPAGVALLAGGGRGGVVDELGDTAPGPAHPGVAGQPVDRVGAEPVEQTGEGLTGRLVVVRQRAQHLRRRSHLRQQAVHRQPARTESAPESVVERHLARRRLGPHQRLERQLGGDPRGGPGAGAEALHDEVVRAAFPLGERQQAVAVAAAVAVRRLGLEGQAGVLAAEQFPVRGVGPGIRAAAFTDPQQGPQRGGVGPLTGRPPLPQERLRIVLGRGRPHQVQQLRAPEVEVLDPLDTVGEGQQPLAARELHQGNTGVEGDRHREEPGHLDQGEGDQLGERAGQGGKQLNGGGLLLEQREETVLGLPARVRGVGGAQYRRQQIRQVPRAPGPVRSDAVARPPHRAGDHRIAGLRRAQQERLGVGVQRGTQRSAARPDQGLHHLLRQPEPVGQGGQQLQALPCGERIGGVRRGEPQGQTERGGGAVVHVRESLRGAGVRRSTERHRALPQHKDRGTAH